MTVDETGAVAVPGGRARFRRLAVRLLWLTVAWNIAEGFVAVSSGAAAGSVALVGFGLDSVIEVTAALVLLWRMGLPDHDERVEAREAAARRVVGMTFFALAAYIALQSAYTVAVGMTPEASGVGLGLAIASLILMPVLGVAKLSNARRLGSPARISRSLVHRVGGQLDAWLVVGRCCGRPGDDAVARPRGSGGAARRSVRRRGRGVDGLGAKS